MSDDPLKRARQALARFDASGVPAIPQPLDRARLETLIARARVGVSEPARAHRVLVDVTCSATGRSYPGLAERHGNRLLLVGSLPRAAGNGASDNSELLSGAYSSVEAARDWVCPECRAPASACVIWTCDCSERNGAVHCGSKGGGASFCACGRYEKRRLVEVGSVAVRGESLGAASRKTAAGRVSPGPASALLSLPRFGKGDER